MSITNGDFPAKLVSLLACPVCKSDLSFEDETFECVQCNCRYSVIDNIPRFASPVSDYQDEEHGIAFRKRYEWQYNKVEDAKEYDESFRNNRRKRQRTRRELEIVERMLSSQNKSEVILDVPCGGGRLSQPVSDKTSLLLEADISPAQIHLALGRNLGNQLGMMISALALPFKNESVDGVVCARLSHHLPNPEERELLLNEMIRVSKSFCVFSFTDRHSIQSLGRRVRGKKLNPCAMSVDEIQTIARSNSWSVTQVMTVSSIGPRHRWALLER